MADFKFISLKGLNNERITINLNYLIRFEPIENERTRIYVDDRTNVVSYRVTILYADLVKQIADINK